MKTLDTLKEGDYIAFGFNYNGGEPSEIMVDKITIIEEDRVLVHFLYGHHSLSEWINKKDIIGIGCHQATGKIKGWSGTFNLLHPYHGLLEQDLQTILIGAGLSSIAISEMMTSVELPRGVVMVNLDDFQITKSEPKLLMAPENATYSFVAQTKNKPNHLRKPRKLFQ